jgi:lysophospholipase L1-like esterase
VRLVLPALPQPPRPGRRARLVALRAGLPAASAVALAAGSWYVILLEARQARRTIGEPKEKAPVPDGTYGRGPGEPLRLVVLGDSAGAGLGCVTADETPGAVLAGSLARELDRPVELEVVAAIGARSAALDAQVGRALASHADVAVIIVGTNDVTHRVPITDAARDLGRAVTTLRHAGTCVVVGTCPDLGTVEPLLQPLRTFAAAVSRRLAQAQTVAVVEAGGVAVSLGDLLGPEFARSPVLWSPDRFHPSAAGYSRVCDVLLPSALELLGEPVAGEPVTDSVQDVALAATVASRDAGLEVETLPGVDGAASAGPGRLARLRRRIPLAGRGEPEALREDTAAAAPAR